MRGWTAEKVVVALLVLLCVPVDASAANTMAVQPDGKILLAGLTEPQFGAVVRLNPDGSRDTSFGEGEGIVVDRRFSPFTAIAVQGDGRIVVAAQQGRAGSEQRPILARYLPSGMPDPSFGRGGAMYPAEHPQSGFSTTALVLRPDGNIVVGGTYRDGQNSPTSARAELIGPDGSELGTFGAVVPFGIAARFGALRGTWSSLADLLQRPDGSVLMAGAIQPVVGTDPPMSPGDSMPMMARFGTSFSPSFDPSFGAGAGVVRPDFFPSTAFLGEHSDAVSAAGDGVLLAGSAQARMLLARFDSNGVLDPSFGYGGVVNPGLGNRIGTRGSRYAEATDTAVEADGGVVAVGSNLNPTVPGSGGLPCENCWEAVLGRFRADGTLDRSFGGGLRRIFGSGHQRLTRGSDVALLPNGKILVSGMEVRGKFHHGRQRLLVSRFQPDGTLDRGFGIDGTASALPCPGTERQRRRAGCLPAARVQLRVHGLAGRSPSLRLTTRSTLSWGRIDEVNLFLPRQIEANVPSPATYTVIANGQRERHHMSAESGEAYPHQIPIYGIYGSRPVTLVMPPGCLRRIAPLEPGHKLVFRVRVKFEKAGKQILAIGRAP
jgi:uncharacterized delta-60 repeat protein